MKRTAPLLIIEILVISTVLHQICPVLVDPHWGWKYSLTKRDQRNKGVVILNKGVEPPNIH